MTPRDQRSLAHADTISSSTTRNTDVIPAHIRAYAFITFRSYPHQHQLASPTASTSKPHEEIPAAFLCQEEHTSVTSSRIQQYIEHCRALTLRQRPCTSITYCSEQSTCVCQHLTEHVQCDLPRRNHHGSCVLTRAAQRTDPKHLRARQHLIQYAIRSYSLNRYASCANSGVK